MQWHMAWGNELLAFSLCLLTLPLLSFVVLLKRRRYALSLLIAALLAFGTIMVAYDAITVGFGPHSKQDVESLQMLKFFAHGIWHQY